MSEKVKVRANGVYAGVILEVEGKEVKLMPKTPLNRVNEDGLELEYPQNAEPIRVKPKTVIEGITKEITGSKYDIEKKIKEADIPILTPIASKVLSGDLTFEKIHYKMPSKADRERAVEEINKIVPDTIKGKEKNKAIISSEALNAIKDKKASPESSEIIQKGQTAQTFAVSLTWDDDATDGVNIGGLALKGIYLAVSNEVGDGEYGSPETLFNLDKTAEIEKKPNVQEVKGKTLEKQEDE